MASAGWGPYPGPLVVLSGPSGSGKSSVVRPVLECQELNVVRTVSATTRPPRAGEVQGVHYWFTDRKTFEESRELGQFYEWAEYNGHLYGTGELTVEKAWHERKTPILIIEVQGALKVRERVPTALFVFLKTPTFRDLASRLASRGTESNVQILDRLRTARRELAEAHWYDHQLVNDDFEACVQEFISLLKNYGCGG